MHLLGFLLTPFALYTEFLDRLVKEAGLCEYLFSYKANQYDTLLCNYRCFLCHPMQFSLCAAVKVAGSAQTAR